MNLELVGHSDAQWRWQGRRGTGYQPGESHFQLLRAFVDDTVLQQVSAALKKHHYRTHEFGDFMLIECRFSG
jgi:S-adenosylmethionine:tRNA-ribosyltransferase-isomerase (queuine synthetase)